MRQPVAPLWACVFLVLSLCLSIVNAELTGVWERDFAAYPDPKARDLETRDYFVAELQTDPRSLFAKAGWTLEEPMPIKNHWVFSVPKGMNYRRHFLNARDRPVSLYDTKTRRLQKRMPVPLNYGTDCGSGCDSSNVARGDSEPTIVLDARSEFNIQDPLFGEQWHVLNSREIGHDMNVIPVWRRNITGAGITVAVVDDGIDYSHPDMANSFSADGSWDYNDNGQLPTPKLSDDTHGTRCAGEIAADFNDFCGVGLAPGAKVAGIRILSGSLSETDEARALIHRLSVNDIYSCSWGPLDDGKTIEGPAPIVRRAEVDGIENGRNGKGAIYVVASGNGNHVGDNCNYDGYTNSIFSVTVAAIDRENAHPYYSESCSANMISTYSSNMVDKIVTTDRQHLNASNNFLPSDEHKCTDQHSGTSAAAPIAAAVFALVLEQRPELTWRDLQYLVRESAQTFELVQQPKLGLDTPTVLDEWQVTADGRKYHNKYGYGVLNADKIVSMAKDWELVGPQAWLIPPRVQTNAPLSDPQAVAQPGSPGENSDTPSSRDDAPQIPYETSVDITITEEQWKQANMKRLEHVKVKVDYEYEKRGALTFSLKSPAGIISELASPRPRDLRGDRVLDWDFMSVVHWGESGVGTWTLNVKGEAPHVGSLYSWQLKLFGEAEDPKKARRYSEDWNLYEVPTELVHDALFSGTTTPHSTPTEHAETTVASSEPAIVTPTETVPVPEPTGTTSPSPSATSTPSEDGDEPKHYSIYVKGLISGLFIAGLLAVVYFVALSCGAPVPFRGNQSNMGLFKPIQPDIELEDFDIDDGFVDIADDDEFSINSRSQSFEHQRDAGGPENPFEPQTSTTRPSDLGNEHSSHDDTTRE